MGDFFQKVPPKKGTQAVMATMAAGGNEKDDKSSLPLPDVVAPPNVKNVFHSI